MPEEMKGSDICGAPSTSPLPHVKQHVERQTVQSEAKAGLVTKLDAAKAPWVSVHCTHYGTSTAADHRKPHKPTLRIRRSRRHASAGQWSNASQLQMCAWARAGTAVQLIA